MTRSKKNQSGFTLIEVLLSMAMLMVIVVPLLSYFSNNAKYNHRAKIHQRSITVGEKIMEEVKSFSTIRELTDYYAGAVTDTGIASTDKYYELGGSSIRGGSGYVFKNQPKYIYWKKGVESDAGKFDVKITVNPGTDDEGHEDSGANTNYKNVNKTGTVAITSLTQSNTAVAKDDSFIENSAIEHFKNLNSGSGGSADDAAVKASLTKTYYIDINGSKIDKAGTENEKRYVVVKITVKYTSTLSGCTGDDKAYIATMFNGLETDEEKLTGIYLFYNYEDNASIKVNFNPYTTYAANVTLPNAMIYAVCQNSASLTSGQTLPISISSGSFSQSNVFSNIQYSVNGANLSAKKMEDMVGTTFVQRIADIKVDVYPIENGVTASTPKVTLTSTRGE